MGGFGFLLEDRSFAEGSSCLTASSVFLQPSKNNTAKMIRHSAVKIFFNVNTGNRITKGFLVCNSETALEY